MAWLHPKSKIGSQWPHKNGYAPGLRQEDCDDDRRKFFTKKVIAASQNTLFIYIFILFCFVSFWVEYFQYRKRHRKVEVFAVVRFKLHGKVGHRKSCLFLMCRCMKRYQKMMTCIFTPKGVTLLIFIPNCYYLLHLNMLSHKYRTKLLHYCRVNSINDMTKISRLPPCPRLHTSTQKLRSF